jgi:hypothetical protein
MKILLGYCLRIDKILFTDIIYDLLGHNRTLSTRKRMHASKRKEANKRRLCFLVLACVCVFGFWGVLGPLH